MRKFFYALTLGLALSFGGCSGLEQLKAPIPADQMTPIQKAQQQINEANLLLTAINQTIEQQVKDGVLKPDTAQDFLNKSKLAGQNIDRIQAAVRAGSGDFSDPAVQLALIRQLQAELHKLIGQ